MPHSNPSYSMQLTVRVFATAVLVSSVLLGTPCIGQQRADPAAIGQAKSSVATARGISSLYSNIGSLALDPLGRRAADEASIEIDATVLPLGIAAGSTYLRSSDLNFVFASKDCDVFTDADRLRLASLLRGEKLSADAAVDIAALRVRVPGIAAFGVRFGHLVRARMAFPEEFLRTVLGTDDVFARDYHFTGIDVGGEWLRSLGFAAASSWRRAGVDPSASSWVPEIGFGLRVDRVEGIAHFDVDPESFVRSTVVYRTDSPTVRAIDVDGEYSFRSSAPQQFEPAQAIVRPGFSDADSNLGAGWSVSAGATVVLLRTVQHLQEIDRGTPLNPQQVHRDEVVSRDAIVVAISLDELGGMTWDGFNLRRHRRIDSVMTDDGNGLTYQMLCEYVGDLDTIEAFETQLPSRLRLGAAFDVTALVPDIAGDVIVGVEGAFDVVDRAVGLQRSPRVSIGAEWRPVQWIALRAGGQFGGAVGSGFSLGAGLRPLPWLSIDAASSEVNSLFQSDPDRYDIAVRVATHLRL